MVDKISGLGPIEPSKLNGTGKSEETGNAFKKVLEKFLSEVNDMQLNADESIKKLASGEIKDLHQVMTALAEADISFKMMMTIRNKLIEAYKEIMKMQV